MTADRSWRLATLACLGVVVLSGGVALAQSPDGEVKPTDPQPPLKYHGLVPGLSTAAETRKALGQPAARGGMVCVQDALSGRGARGTD